jgi:hypothetical protein
LFHEDSASHENHICDEVVTVEESIFYEELEVLDDIHYDNHSTETSGIILEVYVPLVVHADQHVSFENSEVQEKMFSAVDISPEYGTEIDDKLVKRTSEDFSLFLPRFSGLKAEVVCFSCEENAEDISVPETNVLGNLSYEGEVVTDTDRKQPIFDEYPSEDDEEHWNYLFLEAHREHAIPYGAKCYHI